MPGLKLKVGTVIITITMRKSFMIQPKKQRKKQMNDKVSYKLIEYLNLKLMSNRIE